MNYARNTTLTLATLLLVSALASAQGGGPGGGGGGPRPIAVHALHDGVYWTDGGPPSNTGFIVGTDGVIVYDPKGSVESAKEVIADIAKVTPLPITTIVVSHSNPDHTRGLPAYPAGVNVIMQQNAAREVEDLLFYFTWTPAGAGDRNTSIRPYLATQMVDTRADVKINGVNLRLLHWAPAHTSGDLVLYLPDQKIAFLGDIGGAGVHLENNGSSEGMIESVRGLIALDCDTYVRGHAPPATKADLQKGLDDLVARRDKIIALYDQGKSLSEAEQTMGEKVIPRATPVIAGLPVFRAGRDMNFTEIVYTEMSRR